MDIEEGVPVGSCLYFRIITQTCFSWYMIESIVGTGKVPQISAEAMSRSHEPRSQNSSSIKITTQQNYGKT